MLAIDADSHFVEPLDLYEKYIEPQFRERAFRVRVSQDSGKRQLIVDNKPLQLLDVEELLSAVSGYGQKESGRNLSNFDRELPYSTAWTDMSKRIEFLDREGFAAQVIYPTLGLLWEDSVSDPILADAHCRAYNTGPWNSALPIKTACFLQPISPCAIRRSRSVNCDVLRTWGAIQSSSAPHRIMAKASAIRFTTCCGPPLRISIWRSDYIWSAMLATLEANTSVTATRGLCGSR
jgi:hypothetical protein